ISPFLSQSQSRFPVHSKESHHSTAPGQRCYFHGLLFNEWIKLKIIVLPLRPNRPSPEKALPHRRTAGAERSRLLLRGAREKKSNSYGSMKSYDLSQIKMLQR
ncbi:mCG144527, partial [Mus musculus]